MKYLLAGVLALALAAPIGVAIKTSDALASNYGSAFNSGKGNKGQGNPDRPRPEKPDRPDRPDHRPDRPDKPDRPRGHH